MNPSNQGRTTVAWRGVVKIGLALLLVPAAVSVAQAQDNVEPLRERIEALEEQIRQLEAQQDRTSGAPAPMLETAPPTGDGPGGPEPANSRQTESLSDAVLSTERIADEAEAEPAEPPIDIGGALRFNLGYQDFADASESKRGESGLDLFRLNVEGRLSNIIISAEYRYYPYMHTIHHGWLGYEFQDESQLQFGINQVPFGLLPYAAHNFWFGVPYHVGLADDYDMGIKYQRSNGPWSIHLAFYKNEELNDPTNLNRYSFDLVRVRVDEQENEQVNQLNTRLAYTFGAGTDCEVEVGGSGQYSELYNHATDRSGDHWAAATHIDSRCGRWNLQLQGLRYSYDPSNPPGVSDDVVRVGAFADSYDIASEADILVANLAYNFEPPWEQIDQIICYNDYSRLYKDIDGAVDSQINTLGCAVGSGPLFTYIDWIYANNMPFFGENVSMGHGGVDEWRGRLNINVGFYW